MKKILAAIINSIEKNGKYIPYDIAEPIMTNSQK
ncbi:hypothetical protein SAMN05443253_104278 [Bacillus sp. OK048]|nr:hypothetical protein SAMN05443253_104278 [Bacillus sp. OK048]